MVAVSPLFAPFRALGYVCDDVPFAVQRLGTETFVTVSVGKTWQVYNCTKITLVLVGPTLPSRIVALAATKHRTIAALDDGSIHLADRAAPLPPLPSPPGPPGADPPSLLLLGNLLVACYPHRQAVITWDVSTQPAPTMLSTLTLPAGFTPSRVCHPDTYVHKVVVGSDDGRLAVVNVARGTLLYMSAPMGGGGVTALAPSPALDVLGVGLSDGRVVLHNIKFDERVMEFSNASGVGLKQDLFLTDTRTNEAVPPVRAVAFRTGGGVPLMVAGGDAGVVTVWDLEKRRLHSVIKDAHDEAVVSLFFFTGEPVVMSQGADNSLKHWIFDNADGSARLLRFRAGHSAPPVRVRGYGEEGRRLLSAGQDRAFRMLSIVQDQQSRELSQGHVVKRSKRLKVTQEVLKLPPVVAMDACPVRERDWCNVLTAHEDHAAAYVWRLQHFCLGEAALRLPADVAARLPAMTVQAPATAVAISRCGNFGFVGSAAGRIDRYNMQSGLHRGGYQRGPLGGAVSNPSANAHDGGVTGIACDVANTLVVSAGHDGWLRVWDFSRAVLTSQHNVGAPCVAMALHPTSLLAAVACQAQGQHGAAVRVYDVAGKQLVRRFSMARQQGGEGRVDDLCISSDGRWLLAGGSDGLVCVWDIPAGHLLQTMDMEVAVTSLTLSPTLDLLATSHSGQRGISLWTNQTLFGAADRIVPSKQPVLVSQPQLAGGGGAVEQLTAAAQEEDVDRVTWEGAGGAEEGPKGRLGAPEPIVPALVTMSLLPQAQWQTLVHLDAIKARSKPEDLPTKPAAAPFFLPTVPTVHGTPVFDTSTLDDDDDTEQATSRILRGPPRARTSPFISALRHGDTKGDWAPLAALVRSTPPAALDAEIRALAVLPTDDDDDRVAAINDLAAVFRFLLATSTGDEGFDVLHAVLQVVLRAHAEAVARDNDLRTLASTLCVQLKGGWGRLEGLLQQVQCMSSMLGGWHSG